MSKNKAAAHSYDHVTPQLIKRVETVLAEAVNHKYSVSRIYATHNEVFKKRDQPQTCSSCLRNRVRDLKAWFNGMPEDKKLRPAAEEPVQYGKLFSDFMEGRQVNEHSTTEDQRAALLDFQQQYAGVLPDEVNENIYKTLAALAEKIAVETVTPQYDDPAAPGFVAPAPGVTRIPMRGDVLPFDFTTEDGTPAKPGSKGAVKNADGTPVKPGTYVTADGHEIAIQVGGRATFKMLEEDLT